MLKKNEHFGNATNEEFRDRYLLIYFKRKKDESHGQKTNISKIMKQKTWFIKTWFIIEA